MLNSIVSLNYVVLAVLLVVFILIIILLLVFTYNKIVRAIDEVQENHKVYRL